MWTTYIAFLALFVPLILADSDVCLDAGECTALDNTTCVSPGTTQPEGCDTYKCELVNGILTYTVDKSRCQHPNGRCLKENYAERDTGTCTLTTCKRKTNEDGSFTMRVDVKPLGCQHPNGTCLRENYVEGDTVSCTLTTCKRLMNENGSFSLELIVRPFGCQHPNGTCLGENYEERDNGTCMMTTCKRALNEDGSFTMKLSTKPFGCKLPSGGCLTPNRRKVDMTYCKKTICKVLDGEYTVIYNYFGCPMFNKCHISGHAVKGDCMNFTCTITRNKTTMNLKPLGKVSCRIENGPCLDKKQPIRDDVACLNKVCKFFKYRNKTVEPKIVERYYGCPNAGVCEEVGTVKNDTENCSTEKCRIFSNGIFMNWKTIGQGCSVNGECKEHNERWSEDTESMCVLKGCSVRSDGKSGYEWKTEIITHGCRSSNGTCYNNGNTWMDDSCFTKSCTVSETEEGGSSIKTETVGGICKAADGSCVEYGQEFQAQEGGPLCTCAETTAPDGYSIGQTSCPVL